MKNCTVIAVIRTSTNEFCNLEFSGLSRAEAIVTEQHLCGSNNCLTGGDVREVRKFEPLDD